jgi:hypothetical protein
MAMILESFVTVHDFSRTENIARTIRALQAAEKLPNGRSFERARLQPRRKWLKINAGL